MPSIYNHDNNACWGIQRTSYNIFNEPVIFDVSTDKTEHSTSSVVNRTVNKNTFHDPSNGYYGYHIPTNTEANDYAMDTSNVSFDDAVQTEHNVNNVRNTDGDDSWRRKRSNSEKQEETFKRAKKEDSVAPADISSTSVEDASDSSMENNDLPVYNLYRYLEAYDEDAQVVNKSSSRKEEELEFLENYLKQTHGCDLYNLYKTDDI